MLIVDKLIDIAWDIISPKVDQFSLCFRFLFDKETFHTIDPRIEKVLYIFACTNSVMDPIVYGLEPK